MTYYSHPPGGGTPTAINPEEGTVMKNEKSEAELAQYASRSRVLFERSLILSYLSVALS